MHCDCPHWLDIALFLDILFRFFMYIFLHIWRSFASPQVEISNSSVQITVKKNSNLRMFFSLIDIVSNIDYPIFGKQSKVVRTTLPPPIPLSCLKVEWKFWMWLFYKNMKDAFNCIPFLMRPQILLTLIRHLTSIKRDFIKQKN